MFNKEYIETNVELSVKIRFGNDDGSIFIKDVELIFPQAKKNHIVEGMEYIGDGLTLALMKEAFILEYGAEFIDEFKRENDIK
jgi:hypothetical protein